MYYLGLNGLMGLMGIILSIAEHDDRAPLTTDSTRRVSFKNYGNNRNKNFRQRGRDEKMRAALAIHDEDVEMMIGCSYSHNRGR